MNITEIVQQHAKQFPEQMAIIDRYWGNSRCTTYREFDQAIVRTATMLRQSGLQAGDTVLLFHPMSVELYTALAAILRSGMTAMFVDPSAGWRYIDRCCELLPPQALIASSKAHLLRLVSPTLRRIPRKWSIGRRVPFARPFEKAQSWSDDGLVHDCDAETPALASFTSGSTGLPKATIRTHRFLLAQHQAIEQSFGLTPGQVELVTMPIFVLANLASRVTSVIADGDLRRPSEITPDRVLDQIHQHQPNRIAASPAFFDRLLSDCETNDPRLQSLQQIFTGGGPVPPRLLERFASTAPAAEVTVVYGSTEAEPISTVAASDTDSADRIAMGQGKGLLVGSPVQSLDVRIMRDHWGQSVGSLSADDFDQLCEPAGTAGEIVVAGPHVLAGYLHGDADVENKFRVDGTCWHRTGDAGYFDHRGRLWLLGRCAARVDDEHGALYPLGVEQAAMRHPCIGQAAMVSHGGERVLVVTLNDVNAQPDLASLLKSLAFANVDTIRILKRLPVDRRHHSKIDYPALHQLLAQ